MKKILITQSNLTIGGIQKTLINFLNKYNQFSIDLVLYEKCGEYLECIPENVNVYSIREFYKINHKSKFKKIREFINSERYYKKLYNDLLSIKKYDIAIAFDGYNSFSDYFVAFSNAKKKIIWVHSDYYQRKKRQFKFKFKLLSMKNKYKHFDKIVAVSESAKKGFLKIFPYYKKKVTYIWNFVEEPNQQSILEQPDLIFDKNFFNIISIGSLLPVKGYKRLIKVQKKLLKNNLKTKIYIIGEGKQQKKLEKMIKRNRLNNTFILLGRKKNIYPFLKQADLFISSSYYEGFGVVLIESLILGIPILVPKISGAYDIAKYIAPVAASEIVDNSVIGLYNGVINYINKEKVNFEFSITKYNKIIFDIVNEKIMKE